MKNFISKSNYLKGLECPSYLWLIFNEPEKKAKPSNKAEYKFKVGHIVGELAKKVFPKGIDVADEDFKENLKKSEELIKERKILFEAAFLVDNVYSRADILVPVGKDEWDIIEVKSGTKIKDINLHDVSFQKYVCEKYGLKIRKCFLMHINNEYVRMGKIEPEELFVQTDITEEITGLINGVEDKVEGMFKIVKMKERPQITCDDLVNVVYSNQLIDEFYENLPEENVFDLYRIQKKKAIKLYESGVKCIKDIPKGTKLTEKQKIQQVCALENRKHTHEKKLKDFLDSLKYPIYYLDFETIGPAIPKFDGTRPYENIPFQYSLHIVKEKGVEPEHISF